MMEAAVDVLMDSGFTYLCSIFGLFVHLLNKVRAVKQK